MLAYNADRLHDAPNSWADFRRGAEFTTEIALIADGVALDDLYKVLAALTLSPDSRRD